MKHVLGDAYLLSSYQIQQRVPGVGFEPDEYVDVAVRAEVVSQHGTEQGDLSDPPASAECGEAVLGYCDVRCH